MFEILRSPCFECQAASGTCREEKAVWSALILSSVVCHARRASSAFAYVRREFFPTLTVGLLDFKVYVVLAGPEPDCSAQPQSIPAVPDHRVSRLSPFAEYQHLERVSLLIHAPHCRWK